MATAVQVQYRRGTASQVASFTGAQGELVVDTTNNRLVVQDGATEGGFAATKLAEAARLKVSVPVNFANANTDTGIPIPIPPGSSAYLVTAAIICNANGSLTAGTCGLYTAASGGGTAIVTGGTSVTVSTAAANTNNNSQSLSINNSGTQSYTETILYFRVGTAVSGGTATLVLHVIPLF